MTTVYIELEALQRLDELNEWWSEFRADAEAQVYSELDRIERPLSEQPERVERPGMFSILRVTEATSARATEQSQG